MPRTAVTFTARVQRKEAFLPRYIVVPPDHGPDHGREHGSGRTGAFAAMVTLNGVGPFRRNIHP